MNDQERAVETNLSRRGEALIATPPLPEYIREHFTRGDDAYSAESNPDGYICLCLAENRQVWDLLEPKLRAPRNVPHRAVCYDAMIGSLEFRGQLARFMGRSFLGREFEPTQLAVLAGAGCILELLFYGLCDAGDAVLVPTPSYAGFWADLETRNELNIVPVHGSSEDEFQLTPALLDEAARNSPHPVRALLFTSPNNPLGRVYTRAEVLEVLEWAEAAGIHVVFDEIYALSVFGETKFTSVASIRERLGQMVHIVWAFSKDFGLSGLRCGVLISENERLIASVDALAYWAACSGDTQFLLGELISDDRWVDSYILSMQARLKEVYREVSSALERGGIRFLPAAGGFFVICDLRPFLSALTWEEEHRLWRRLLDEANVNLTPGSACHNKEPGFMRLCFAGLPAEDAVVAVERMVGLLCPDAR